MSKENLTELEKGIVVYIDSEELERLKTKKGFLEYTNYPDEYKEISKYAEVGRFLIFRFILK
jgi:hypothetical protein